MAINFNTETQYLTFKPEYLTETPPALISVRKNGVEILLIDPSTCTQDEMVSYFTLYNLWHLFDINEK